MINTYRIIKDNIQEAYADIETFETKIIKFKDINPQFGYDLNIIKDENDKWNVIATLWTDEKDKKTLHRANVALFGVC